MRRVARLLLECDPQWLSPLYADCAPAAGVRVKLRRGHASLFQLFSLIVGWQYADYDDYDLARHEPSALWQVWLSHFAPGFDEEKAARHPAIEAVSECYVDSIVDLQGQTAHERLESLLQLRDWLRERVGLPDERIAALLA